MRHRLPLTVIALGVLLPAPGRAQFPPAPTAPTPAAPAAPGPVSAAGRAGAITGAVIVGVAAVGGIAFGAAASDGEGAGLLVAETGMILGPTIGNAVAGLGGRAATGFLLRAGVGAGSFAAAWAMCGWDCSDPGAATVVWLAGTMFVVGHAVWDLATMHRAAVRHEERKRAREVTVVPTWDPGTHATGLGVRIGF